MTHVPIGTRRGTGACAECLLPGELHRRARERGRQGSVSVPARADRAQSACAETGGRRLPAPRRFPAGARHGRQDVELGDAAARRLGARASRSTIGAGRRRTTSTICAQVLTVEVTRRGQLKLHRADVAFEQGFAFMHPLAVRKQIEGQINWGYDDTMYQATTLKDGRAVERNFDTFPVSRISDYPKAGEHRVLQDRSGGLRARERKRFRRSRRRSAMRCSRSRASGSGRFRSRTTT